jgi:hypothetical protein
VQRIGDHRSLEARDHRVLIAPNSERFHRAKVDERENSGKGHHHKKPVRNPLQRRGLCPSPARLVVEGERQAEIERKRRETDYERWRREAEARRAAKALKDSKEDLLQVIDAWGAAKRPEEFFADAELRAQDLPDEQRERTIERLRRARALIGSTDALERFDAWRAPEER